MLKMFLILTYFWNLILLLPRLLGAFLSDTSTLVCFLMVSPEKHDGPLPPTPEHHPEQGFPTSRQADQGPWAGTRTEGDCGCVCSMGSHPAQWRCISKTASTKAAWREHHAQNQWSLTQGRACSNFSLWTMISYTMKRGSPSRWA